MSNFLLEKEKFGVAFGGGSARGFVHIGIIKFLEEKGLKANEISGTSMGSIIGSLYAFGYNYNDIYNLLKKTNFLSLIDFGGRKGIIAGKRIEKKLYEIFGNINIEELKVPLSIVTTNVSTGEKEVFRKGSLVKAIRASISIPGVFCSYLIDGIEYVDGGIVTNLPVEEISLNNVLAISTGQRFGKTENCQQYFNKLNIGVIQKTMQLIIYQNEKRILKDTEKNVILIKPEIIKEYGYHQFNKWEKLIDIGYNELSKLYYIE